MDRGTESATSYSMSNAWLLFVCGTYFTTTRDIGMPLSSQIEPHTEFLKLLLDSF